MRNVPVLDTIVLAAAPNAATHPAPARTAWVVVVARLVNVGFEALRATISVSTTVSAAFPLGRAGLALRLQILRDVGTLPIVVVGTFAAVDVVLTGVTTNVCTFVQRYHRIRGRSIALLTARNELLALQTSELSEPISIFTRARAVPILCHMRKDTVLDIAAAFTYFAFFITFRNDRQEV